MSRVRVHVIGNAAVDMMFDLDRLPAPGETVLARARRADTGGKGANQAVAAARSGIPTRLVAPIGDDEEGRAVLMRLRGEGVDLDCPVVPGCRTDVSIINVDASGENTIVTDAGAAIAFEPDWPGILAGVGAGDIVLMQGNLRRDVTVEGLRQARSRGAATVLNPAPVQPGIADALAWVDHLILNETEAAALSGCSDPEPAAAWLRDRGIEVVVLTLGRRGALLAMPQGAVPIPAARVAAVDTAGAGDVFCGTYAAGLGYGFDPVRCARLANAAAGLSVTRRGTMASFPTRDDMLRLFDGPVA